MDKLITRISKTVFKGKTSNVYTMNFPKQAVEQLGQNYIFDLYEDKIVMTPINKK